MITIYNIKKNTLKENNSYILGELRGLHDDVKPSVLDEGIIDNGSSFIEIDTGKVYLYDLENETWNEV